MQHQNCRDEGGVLHIHGNVKDTEEGVWTNHVVQMISEIVKSEGISYPRRVILILTSHKKCREMKI